MLATTTELVTLPSTTIEVNEHSWFIKPKTLRRLLFEEGTSMVSPRGYQALETQGSKVNPDSSK